MTADGVKITWIGLGDELSQRNREGFTSACQYGTAKPERFEIGAITAVVGRGKPKYHAPSGLWLIRVKYLERIFIVEPVGDEGEIP